MMIILSLGSACSWQLRDYQKSSIDKLYVRYDDNYSPFALALKKQLQTLQINDSQTANVSLAVKAQPLKRQTVAVTSIGSASQYEMMLEIDYSLLLQHDPKIRETDRLKSVRIFDFEAGNNLAKTQEENTLLDEMRHELARRLLAQAARFANRHGQD